MKQFRLAMNHMGDYTNLEYRHLMLGTKYNHEISRSGSTYLPPSSVKVNASVDWRKYGYVTGVKNQGMYYRDGFTRGGGRWGAGGGLFS